MGGLNRVACYRDFEELKGLIEKSIMQGNQYDLEKIEKAYKFADEAHGDQKRVSGVPYILHPTSVACILVELGMDTDSLVAALLHDVVEDTPVTIEEVTKLFGETVANLIDGVTKISKIPYSNREEQQAENVRKMLIAMSNDIRVIIIKLADRLHNMRTMECMKDQKRRDKARETMEVYAPIAHRLGIKAVKEELEDYSIRYLDPVGYAEIEQELALTADQREEFLNDVTQKIEKKTKEIIPNVFVSSRIKSVHSIYRKTYMQGKTVDQIFDIYAVRVIVDTVNDCYNVLGVVHDLFQPLPNRFKDYISTPKSNMYQSLHTTVIDKRGIPFEIQIRTWEMHYTAEYGIAAHWKYKLGLKGKRKGDSLDESLKKIRQMIESQLQEADSTNLIKTIKNDLDPNEVYVFTPKGDVISLPAGSTVIDMAYAIHSGVGNSMIGAKADKRIVPIDYQVKNGEIIEILTQKEGSGPKRDWLKIVKTSQARTKIRNWFKHEKRDENILEGKAELEKEFRKNMMYIPEKELPEFFAKMMVKQHCNTMDDFYAAIGYGGIQLWRLMPRIKEEYSKKYKKTEEDNINEILEKQPEKKKKISSGIIVEGMDDVLIKLSKCCNPLPGDDIIGFITRGYGVSIHKCSCTNVPKDISKTEEPERWVEARWSDSVKDTFHGTIEILCDGRTGYLADLAVHISAMHLSIHSINSHELSDDRAIITLTIDVKSIDHMNSIVARLSNINGTISITRK